MTAREKRNAGDRAAYARNPTKKLASVTRWRKQNPGKVRQMARNYSLTMSPAQREKMRRAHNARQAAWYARNREKQIAATLDWYSRNREKAKASMRAWRARQRQKGRPSLLVVARNDPVGQRRVVPKRNNGRVVGDRQIRRKARVNSVG